MTKGQNINNELNSIVDSLGDVYLNMADNYPNLMKKLEKKIELLGANQDSRDSSGVNIDFLVRDIKETVSKEVSILNDISKRDTAFLDSISVELETIKDIDLNIDQIEDDSAELELISLNAMVTALKSGKNGGAFPYITEELQKVSKSSAKLSNGLKSRGQDLNNYFTDFLKTINNEKNNLNLLINSIGADFSNLAKTTSDYQLKSSGVISTVKKQVKDFKKPLYEILGEVQKHDIVRQSIDHVIMAINHIKKSPETGIEDSLESLTYSSRVYGFCNEILDEIDSELKKTYFTFKEKSDDLNSLIGFLKDSSQTLRYSNEDLSNRDQILELQENIQIQLEKLKKESVQDQIKSTLEGIYKEIANLEAAYNGFAKIISWVKTINISSRVEAAKLPHLENMGYIIENITIRTDSIENSVDMIMHSISLFKKNTDNLFQDYFTHSMKDTSHIEYIAENLQMNLTQVNNYSKDLDFRMNELLLTVDDFIQLHSITTQDLKKMDSLMNKIQEIIQEVKIEKSMVEKDLNRLLKQENLEEWELKGDEIKQLIDKFTIYIHKKKVDRGNSLEMDKEGAVSGEVTLF